MADSAIPKLRSLKPQPVELDHDLQWLLTQYELLRNKGVPADAASRLILAAELTGAVSDLKSLDSMENLSHGICLGIRKGLFGADASSAVSVEDLAGTIAESIDRLSPNEEK